MWPFDRRGPSGFSSASTAEEVTEGIDGSGLTAIVTGASSGIGTETARVLALRGVHVVMGVRNLSAGNNVKDAVLKETPAAKLNVLELDLSSMASVKNFASEFYSLKLSLNILINNAGIMATPLLYSKDGIEMQFATNHIGHFLLTQLLMENMKNTASKSNTKGRIVNVSSVAHNYTYSEGIRLDSINDKSRYNNYFAYGQSKLANILHANELTRCCKEGGAKVTANSLHPGVIATNLFRHQGLVNVIASTVARFLTKNVHQGAATTCYVALHPQVDGIGGKYFSDCNLSTPSSKALDIELAKKLWDFSMKTVSPWL